MDIHVLLVISQFSSLSRTIIVLALRRWWQAGRTPSQVTKAPDTKVMSLYLAWFAGPTSEQTIDRHMCGCNAQAFFAEAATNPAIYSRIPGGTGGNSMSAADAPFVDAAAEEQGLEL